MRVREVAGSSYNMVDTKIMFISRRYPNLGIGIISCLNKLTTVHDASHKFFTSWAFHTSIVAFARRILRGHCLINFRVTSTCSRLGHCLIAGVER